MLRISRNYCASRRRAGPAKKRGMDIGVYEKAQAVFAQRGGLCV